MRLIDADALFESLIFPSEQWMSSFKQILDDEPTAYPNERIQKLVDVTSICMEELIAESAMVHVDCGNCPIKSICDKYRNDKNTACTDVWIKYLKGEEDAKET